MVDISKKSQKNHTRTDIDQLINDAIFPDSQVDTPGKANWQNINISLVTYATTLQKANTSSTIQFYNLSQNAVTLNILASHDIDKLDSFPNLDN